MEIRPNDYVRHMPSGEEWVVCGINYKRNGLVPCGYPFPTLAKITDCELLESRDLPQTTEMKEALQRCGMSVYIEGTETGTYRIVKTEREGENDGK